MQSRGLRTGLLVGLMSVIALMGLTGSALAAGEMHQTVEGYQVGLALETPTRTGANEVTVTMLDSQGKPLKGAAVSVSTEELLPPAAKTALDAGMGSGMGTGLTVTMDSAPASGAKKDTAASGGMSDSSMSNAVELKPGSTAGSYTGEVEFPEAGRWAVKVHFKAGGWNRSTKFTVDVARRTPDMALLGGFLGLNALVILSAAIAGKRKPTRD